MPIKITTRDAAVLNLLDSPLAFRDRDILADRLTPSARRLLAVIEGDPGSEEEREFVAALRAWRASQRRPKRRR